jgi:16S rRNA (adenine1518-N6/adenine1519-N6)-dimethyltransferase
VTALPPLRDVIRRHGLSASKALGQNFLFDHQLLTRIAKVPGYLDGAEVFEVGPGPGGLTRALLEAGAQVTAVERDRRCIPALAELAEAFPGKLKVIEGDALEVDAPALFAGKPHVVANLPYNVGTALLVGWLSAPWEPWWASLTLMFQREVAERIVAAPGSDAYGRLAVLAQWRAHPRIAMTVHRSAFTPPPKVMSAVVHVVAGEEPAGVRFPVLEKLTAAAFGQRRKMLRQSLKGVPGAIAALEALGIDSSRRAETVTIDEFVAIARALSSP